MRILHIVSSPAAGGAETYLKDLCAEMKSAGSCISILFMSSASDIGRCPKFEKSYLEFLQECNITYYIMPSGANRNILKGGRYFKSVLREVTPQIIHTHLLSAVVYTRIFGSTIPHVYTHHMSVVNINHFVFKLLISKCKCIIAISKRCEELLTEFHPRIKLIYNAVNTERIMPKKGQFFGNKIIAVGRFSEPKNYPLLIDSIAKLNQMLDTHFVLNIVGEGSLADTKILVEQVNKLGLSEKVIFLGNRNDVPYLLSEADIFVMSSSSEGLPISLIEAQMSGLPAVVTDVGSCGEFIDITKGGLVVKPESSDELSNALNKLILDIKLRNDLSMNALSNTSDFDIKNCAQIHQMFYKELANNEWT